MQMRSRAAPNPRPSISPAAVWKKPLLLDCVTLRSGLYCPALRLGRGEKVAPIPRDATAVLVDAVEPDTCP